MSTNRVDKMKRRKKEKKITYKMQANFLLAFGVVVVVLIVLIGIIIKINIYMKKVFIKFKECFCNFIGGMLEDEYIDMCMKQEYLNKVNKK